MIDAAANSAAKNFLPIFRSLHRRRTLPTLPMKSVWTNRGDCGLNRHVSNAKALERSSGLVARAGVFPATLDRSS
jgi:hypothetical protein